jgi:hypothetical protein
MAANSTASKAIIRFILTGLGMGILDIGLSVLGAMLAVRIWGTGDLIDLGLAIMGFSLGYIIGVCAGLITNKYWLRQPGSVLLGMLAAIVWAGLIILVLILWNSSSVATDAVIITALILTPYITLGGFHLKRK